MIKRIGVAALAYAAFAVVTTWPLVRELGSALPGWLGDQSYNMWAMDTFWRELAAGRNPLMTHRILYPLGANLAHTDAAPAMALLAGPFWFWGGPTGLILFFDVLCLASIVVAGLGMRRTILTLTDDPDAAFWGGLFYAGSPTLLSFVGSPWHFKVAAAAILPWALDALLRFVKAPRPRALGALSAMTFLLLFTGYYIVFMFLPVVVTVGLITMRRALIRPVSLGIVANGLILAALLLTILPPLDISDQSAGGFWSMAHINLADLFVPGVQLNVEMPGVGPDVLRNAGLLWNGVLGGLAKWASDRGPDPDSYFIGYGVLVLIAVALFRPGDRRMWGLFAGAVVIILLACGTAIQWGATVLAHEQWTPFYWLMRIQSLRTFDLPRCFVLGAAAPLIALAGTGLATLHRRWPAWVVGMLALGIFVVDYGRIGIQLSSIPVPAIYRELATMPGDRTLLELPMGIVESKGGIGWGDHNSRAMFWQTIHGKPRVACYISRISHTTLTWFIHTPVIGDLLLLTGRDHTVLGYYGETRGVEFLPNYPPEIVDHFIRQFNLGYVLLLPISRQPLYMKEIERLLGRRVAERRSVQGYELYVLR